MILNSKVLSVNSEERIGKSKNTSHLTPHTSRFTGETI